MKRGFCIWENRIYNMAKNYRMEVCAKYIKWRNLVCANVITGITCIDRFLN